MTDTEKNALEAGVLYVVATPVGNMSDITERALKVLRGVSFIAAEDTRVTGRLLFHFGITKPMISYHEHNKNVRGAEIIARLRGGESCALVTDAGTPAVSDPGEDLVRLCAESGVPVTAIPGACAAITAVMLAGLPSSRFAFEGFLGNTAAERRTRLEEIAVNTYTLVFYEAPHRLRDTLNDIYEILGDRKLSLCRELTKLNEEVIRITTGEAVRYFTDNEPRGEYVVVVAGRPETDDEFWREMTVVEHVDYYTGVMGLDRMEAVKITARDRKVAKNVIYKELNIGKK